MQFSSLGPNQGEKKKFEKLHGFMKHLKMNKINSRGALVKESVS